LSGLSRKWDEQERDVTEYGGAATGAWVAMKGVTEIADSIGMNAERIFLNFLLVTAIN